LFAVLGTTYGPGDGSTTFNLPDFRGRVLAGADNMGGTAANRLTAASGWFIGATLGNFAGLETHTLTTPQIPSHNHGITDPGHGHLFDRPAFMADFDRGTGSSIWSLDTLQTAATTQGATGITINNTGGGSAHNNVQPSIIVNYILRTGI
jgi:microcystin-dependent protein